MLDWARALGFDALNVTHPCKQLVIEHLDDVDDVAAALGAVNTVSSTGPASASATTPTPPVSPPDSPRACPARPPTTSCCSARAERAPPSATRCCDLGTDHLTVVDLDVERATALASELAARHPEARVDASSLDKLSVLLPDSDGVVHCTPTGMADHPGMPFDADLLHPGLWVADIVYRPLDTALLSAARAAGCRTLDGGHMAVHQATDAFALDHRHHPRRRTHVPALPQPRRLNPPTTA